MMMMTIIVIIIIVIIIQSNQYHATRHIIFFLSPPPPSFWECVGWGGGRLGDREGGSKGLRDRVYVCGCGGACMSMCGRRGEGIE